MLTPKPRLYTAGLRVQRNSVLLNYAAHSGAVLESGNRGFGRAAIPIGTILYAQLSIGTLTSSSIEVSACGPTLPAAPCPCSACTGQHNWEDRAHRDAGMEVLKLRGCPSPAALHNIQVAVASSKFSGGFTSTHEIFCWTPS